MTFPIMESLPSHLRNEILFKMDIISLAMMGCTNRFFHSLIFSDPSFQSEYYSRVGSGLFPISAYRSNMLCYHSLDDSRPPSSINILKECRILGSCCGLLLLSLDALCVVNPLTKTFRFLNQHWSRFFLSRRLAIHGNKLKYLGLAVYQIHQSSTIQTFKVVCMAEVTYSDRRTYKFEINTGYSWKLSKTMLTCSSSDLDSRMRKPVYVDGSLHWLRNDGSIIAFNPKTEEARHIPTKFPEELSLKTLFAAGDNSLTLVSATEEVIDVYVLEKILTNPKWVLVRRIPNEVLNGKKMTRWSVESYDGKCLVLKDETTGERELHEYNMRANKWRYMGPIPGWCDAMLEYFQYTPSLSSVIGLDEIRSHSQILSRDHECISSLKCIMQLVIDGVDPTKKS